MGLWGLRLSTARIRQQPIRPRPYVERKHPLPCPTDTFFEVLILILQPNQGCLLTQFSILLFNVFVFNYFTTSAYARCICKDTLNNRNDKIIFLAGVAAECILCQMYIHGGSGGRRRGGGRKQASRREAGR